MANQITIKSGASKPTTSKLADKEMGFDTRAKKLYIRNGSNIVGLSDFLPITGGTVSGPLTVIGRTALDGSLTVGSTLNANGKLNARQGLGVTGAADISGRFTAMSTIKSYGKISANGGLDVNGRLAANHDLVVGTKGIHNQGDLKTDGDLEVDGETVIYGRLRLGIQRQKKEAIIAHPYAGKGFDANNVDRIYGGGYRSIVSFYGGVNCPNEDYAVLETMAYSADWVRQVYYGIQTGIYTRFYDGNNKTWSDWKKIGG